MKNKHRLTTAERKERRRREAEKHRILEEEGFTEQDIMFMSKAARKALMKKYGVE